MTFCCCCFLRIFFSVFLMQFCRFGCWRNQFSTKMTIPFNKQWNLYIFMLSSCFMLLHFAQFTVTVAVDITVKECTIHNTVEISLRAISSRGKQIKPQTFLLILPENPCLVVCPNRAGMHEAFLFSWNLCGGQGGLVYGLLLDRWKDTTTGIALPNLCSAPDSRDEALGGVRGSESYSPPSPFPVSTMQKSRRGITKWHWLLFSRCSALSRSSSLSLMATCLDAQNLRFIPKDKYFP